MTVGLTLIAVLVVLNVTPGEKTIEHRIERLYSTEDPQFLRAIQGSDLVLGSRYQQGRVTVVNWPIARLILVHGFGWSYRRRVRSRRV